MPAEYDPSPIALFQPERADTVFRLGAPASLDALAVEAARLAYLRFDESHAEHVRLIEALALAGFGEPTLFEHAPTSGEGYGTTRADGLALLAFRGTQPNRLRDLSTDAQFFLRPWELGPGRVHAGFRAAALGLWPPVQAWLADVAPRRGQLLVCGHSLGAAVAALLALPARATRLVTLGSPRVGDAAFVAALDAQAGLEQVRLVDCCDLVVEMPPALLGFAHAGGLRYIDRAGQLAAAPSSGFIAGDQLRARAEYLRKYAFRNGSVPARELADHAPANYLRAYYERVPRGMPPG
jgi:pimeloyl-ACP methyl ester carboxylesterase